MLSPEYGILKKIKVRVSEIVKYILPEEGRVWVQVKNIHA